MAGQVVVQIPRPHIQAGKAFDQRELTRQPQTLIAAEEKRLIAAVIEMRDSHRTANEAAKVIHVQRRFAGERIAGGQGGVLQVFKPSPMIVIGPCL